MKPKYQLPFLAAFVFAHSAQAASDSWNVNASGLWSDAANWAGLQVPGASLDTANGDVATFSFALTAPRLVTVDANHGIGGISFGNTTVFGYMLSGGNLLLNSGGTIQTLAGNGAHMDTISSAIQIQGDGGSATFAGNASGVNSFLNIGSVTGVSSVSNLTTLNLDGTNTGGNVITGIIGDGTGGGKLAIAKAGAGTWQLNGANTYTGATTLTLGTLVANHASALGIGGDITFAGGTLQYTATSAGQDWATRFKNSALAILLNTNNSNVTLAGAIDATNSGGLTKSGGGVLTLSGPNAYTGVTTIGGALGTGIQSILRLDHVNALDGGGNITFAGGRLQYTANNTADYSSRIVGSTSGAIAIDTNGQNVSFGIALASSNTGGLNKLGTGDLTFGGDVSHLYTGTTAVNGGRLILDNTGVGNNNADRIVNGSNLTLNTGTFLYNGSGETATDSTETVGAISVGVGTLTVAFGGSNAATLTGSSLGQSNRGSTLVNGINLGMDTSTTTSVGRIKITAAPTLAGTTNAADTGIVSGVTNTKIVPFLVGEATATSGGVGTATGTANTFVTWNANTGLRPLNPTDEFVNNSITAAQNIYLTAATTATASAAINSLVINGGDLSVNGGVNLTNTSGAILFASSNSINPGGSFVFTGENQEYLVTVNPGVTATIRSAFTGTANGNQIALSGGGTLNLGGRNVLNSDTNSNKSSRLVVEGGSTLNVTGLTTAYASLASNRGNGTNLVGESSGGNTLTISETGRLMAGGINIGRNFGNNTVTISAPGNVASSSYLFAGNGAQLNMGISSSNNTLTVSNGAYMRSIQGGGTTVWNIGATAGADNNAILITGVGSTIDRNSGSGSELKLGLAGSGNSITVSGGGLLRPRRLGIGVPGGNFTLGEIAAITGGGSNNYVLVTGLGSSMSMSDGQLRIGNGPGAQNNYLSIEAGATTTTGAGATSHVGAANGADNNFIRVTGANSLLTTTFTTPLTFGGTNSGTPVDTNGKGNHLDIYDGGILISGSLELMGVNSAFNLGNAAGVSTATVGLSGAFTPGIFLRNADSRLNFNGGRLIAGAAGSLVSGLGSVVLNGPAYISTTQSNSSIASVIADGIGNSLTKEGSGTLILSASNTYTGSTTIAAGTVTLDYTVDAGKLADTSTLVLSGGILNLLGGSHIEVIDSTSLLGGRSGVTSSGAILRMNAITPGLGIINFGASGVADTDNTNTNGILGAWATLGGSDWATSATSGSDISITAYTGYTDIDAGSGLISDGASTNVRLFANGSPGNITLGAPTTTINTLLQGNASVPATVDTDGATLATDGIMIGTGQASLTIGAAAGDGSLQTATAGANLVLNNNESASTLTVNSPIVANGSAGLATAGAVTLNGVNTYSGGTGIGGALTIGGAGRLGGGTYNGAISISGAGSLVMNSSANQTLGGVISGYGTFTQAGAGTTTLSGDNAYLGATTVNGGILSAGHANAFGPAGTASLVFGSGSTGKVRLNGNNITVTSLNSDATPGTPIIESGSGSAGTDTLTVNADRSSTGALVNSSFAGVIQDGSTRQLALVKNGPGGLTIGDPTGSSSNTYSGGTTVNGGTLTLANKNGLGTGVLTLAAGSVFQQSSFEGDTVANALPNEINLSGGQVFFNIPSTQKDIWLDQDVTGNGTIRLISDASGQTLTLSGAKSFTGGIIQTSGSLANAGAGDNQHPNVAIDNVASLGTGMFRAQINSISTSAGFLKPIADLSGGTGVENDIEIAASSRLLVDASSSNHLQLSGEISGNGSLRKIGDATLTLSNTNTYTGTTHVDAGTLVVNGSITSTGAVSVGFSGTLGGTGTIGGTTTIQGFHTPGTSAGIQTFSNGLLYAGTSVLTWELNDDITTGRGANFDGIDLAGGDLTIAFGSTIDLSFGASVDFLDSFWGSNRSWTVIDLGSGVSTDGGLDIFALGAINGGANYNPLLGTFDVVRVADVNLKNDVVLQWTSSAAPSTYATWAAAFNSPVLSDQAADADPDFDGLENALEYVIGSDPRTPNQGGPSGGVVGTNLVLNLTRVDSSETADVGLKVEVSTDLQDWTTIGSYTIGEDTGSSTSGVVVDEGTPTTDPDAITITIPKGVDVKKFARVTVTITP